MSAAGVVVHSPVDGELVLLATLLPPELRRHEWVCLDVSCFRGVFSSAARQSVGVWLWLGARVLRV